MNEEQVITIAMSDDTSVTLNCHAWFADEHGTLVIKREDDLGIPRTKMLVAAGTWLFVTADFSVVEVAA